MAWSSRSSFCAEALLEEPADACPRLEADVVFAGREDRGAAERAVLVEEVAHAGVADGGDLAATLRLQPDLARAQAGRRRTPSPRSRCSRRAGRRSGRAASCRRGRPRLRCTPEHAARHHAAAARARSGRRRARGCPRSPVRNFGDGPRELALDELQQLRRLDLGRDEVREEIGQDARRRSRTARLANAAPCSCGDDGAAPEVELPGHPRRPRRRRDAIFSRSSARFSSCWSRSLRAGVQRLAARLVLLDHGAGALQLASQLLEPGRCRRTTQTSRSLERPSRRCARPRCSRCAPRGTGSGSRRGRPRRPAGSTSVTSSAWRPSEKTAGPGEGAALEARALGRRRGGTSARPARRR